MVAPSDRVGYLEPHSLEAKRGIPMSRSKVTTAFKTIASQ